MEKNFCGEVGKPAFMLKMIPWSSTHHLSAGDFLFWLHSEVLRARACFRTPWSTRCCVNTAELVTGSGSGPSG